MIPTINGAEINMKTNYGTAKRYVTLNFIILKGRYNAQASRIFLYCTIFKLPAIPLHSFVVQTGPDLLLHLQIAIAKAGYAKAS